MSVAGGSHCRIVRGSAPSSTRQSQGRSSRSRMRAAIFAVTVEWDIDVEGELAVILGDVLACARNRLNLDLFGGELDP